ncbi:MAG: hypothetical protein IPH66_02915 [Crocinitomicaceae bacterium]|nr:hypothetical protein [Crocinitomicaceae bacterium]
MLKPAFISRFYFAFTTVFLLFFIELTLSAQSSSSSYKTSNFYAGYSDTLINKNDVIFQKHALPFLVGIWYPVTEIDSAKRLVFGDFFNEFESNELLSPSIYLMKQNLQKIVAGYQMEPDFFIRFKNPSKTQLAKTQKMFLLQTDSYRSKLPDAEKYPCLVYHHGSGSNPFENHELFELLAKNGYVVISASYMLADSTNQKLISNHTTKKSYAGDIEFITEFVRNLSFIDTSKILLMGPVGVHKQPCSLIIMTR